MIAICPHGDPTCPCPDGDACHYEGADAMICPNPTQGFKGQVNAHCHMEGCSWYVRGCAGIARKVRGECGLLKLGFPPAIESDDGEPFWSMAQAKPGSPAWACGWIRTPLNVANREGTDGDD